MRWLQPIQQADLMAFKWCMARRRRVLLTAFGRAVSKTADGWLYLFFVLGYGLLSSEQALLQIIVGAFIVERALYWVLKNSCRRHRPADAIPGFNSFICPSDQFSFPSGHTSAAFLFATLVTGLFPFVGPVLFIWAALVGCSRVFLGVHFPTDTVAGAALGSVLGLYALSFGGLL